MRGCLVENPEDRKGPSGNVRLSNLTDNESAKMATDLGLELTNTVYALDSTTIDLCLSLFPWAHFRST